MANQGTSFGVLLKRYRLAAGLSQEALAERARISARAISSYERGLRQAPYRGTLAQLIRALQLSPVERRRLEAAVQRRRAPRSTGGTRDHRTNLPVQRTSFVGRVRETAEVTRLLDRTRLLTLVGSGGCGKTRLALHVAGELLNAFPDGVWLVDLAPLSDPILVPRAVANAIGLRDEPGLPLLDTLVAALQPRRLLIVLDNCEHLRDASAHLADTLVRACPNVWILATSRQSLGVAAETSRRVASLPVPEFDSVAATTRLGSYEAVQLFVERARALQPGFGLTHQNAQSVSAVCRQLDGIPLAIELAAARVRVLSVDQIAQRLDDRLLLLTGGARDALPRQHTLRATLDWSYALLTDAEQKLFRRLAIFVGTFNLDAVEAVNGDSLSAYDGKATFQLDAVQRPALATPTVLDLLSDLIDKSMVQVEEVGGEARYRLLETLRQYGQEKLVELGEAEAIRRRHRRWYRSLVERAEPELTGAHQRFWLDRLQHDYENIRAVIEDSVRVETDVGEGLHIGAALLRLWVVRGYLAEGRRLLEPLLEASQRRPDVRHTPAGMGALHTVGFAAYFQGDYTAMQAIGEEWLAIAQDLEDERSIWMARDMLARVWMNQGDYVRARNVFADQLGAMRRHGYAFGVASALIGLGVVARLQGDYSSAVAWCEECLEVSRQSGDIWFIGQALSNSGLAHYQLGRYATAHKHFVEALDLRRELDDRSGTAWSLINLGDVALARGELNEARNRFEESLSILTDLGDRSGRSDAMASLGHVAEAQSDVTSARQCYLESLTLRRDLGQRVALPALLEDLAGLAVHYGHHSRALTLAGAAARLRETLGAPPSAADRDRVTRWLEPMRVTLGAKSSVAWNTGQSMPLDQALAYALEDDDPLAC